MKPKEMFLLSLLFLLYFNRSKAIKGIGAILKTKFLPPYTKNGKTTFANTQGKTGVYLIKEDGEIVYVGYSGSNLYRTLYRHFQAWNHSYQKVITYKGNSLNRYTVRVILTTPQQADRLETYLIKKYLPRDNQEKIKAAEEDTGKTVFKKMQEAEEFKPMPF